MAQQHLAVGLISGTSADGIDAVVIRTTGEDRPELLSSMATPYPEEIRQEIIGLYEPGENEIDRMGVLDRKLGHLFAKAALAVIQKAGLTPKEISVIGSHGQTIRHRPPVFTLQIASPFAIAAETGITTVGDFRPADMMAGGDGAPLAPFLHSAVFGESGKNVGVLNLGGIANLTALPGETHLPVTGGDTGPANTLLDHLAEVLSNGERCCDTNGESAAAGVVDESALAWLMDHDYFQHPFPKSTGREIFGQAYLKQFMKKFAHLPESTLFSTLTQQTVESCATACDTLFNQPPHRLILCGGGAQNAEMLRRFQARLPTTKVVTSTECGVDADSLEAQAFAWFAVRTRNGQIATHPEVTGASKATILGAVYPVLK
ncbi:MAG: anhydro-N-acetylmuramic acid kinase [Magnetococcales bacterium]|nr:anhydro-N-acetylmuramic acid kinase [Magnetococcales bacterium]